MNKTYQKLFISASSFGFCTIYCNHKENKKNRNLHDFSFLVFICFQVTDKKIHNSLSYIAQFLRSNAPFTWIKTVKTDEQL